MAEFSDHHKILTAGYFNDVLRTWQTRTSKINPDCLIYPVFVTKDPNQLSEITSLPGQYHVGIDRLHEYLSHPVELGLKTVLLFACMDDSDKDENGSSVDDETLNPVLCAIRVLKDCFPNLVIACDVCLCGFTSHGHCGILKNNGSIDNQASIKRLADAAFCYAQHGAHIVAPSDMMDGTTKAISDVLKKHNMRNNVTIMRYSAKFASCYYGPFRDACKSSPGFGDRKSYQLPPGSSSLARRAVLRDVEEEADILMVKPGLPYLDIVKQTKDMFPEFPLAIYQVSGEYAMLWHSAKAGVFDLRTAVFETLESMHRAGADILITYYTPKVLEWLQKK